MQQPSIKYIIGLDKKFNYRGKNQSRVDKLSDAIYALATTLLVLSSIL